MKITIEAHERTYTAELEDDIGVLNEAVRGLLVAVGYHINTVDEYFPHWESLEGCECDACRETYPWNEKIEEARKTFHNLSEQFTKDELGEHFGI